MTTNLDQSSVLNNVALKLPLDGVTLGKKTGFYYNMNK